MLYMFKLINIVFPVAVLQDGSRVNLLLGGLTANVAKFQREAVHLMISICKVRQPHFYFSDTYSA